MKLPLLTRWLLRHGTPASIQDELTGDLLEEMHTGRSRFWLWRQTLAAVAVNRRSIAAHYVQIALFSMVWCLPLPAFMAWCRDNAYYNATYADWIRLDWPLSAFTTVPLEFAPVIAPLWIGLVMYLRLHRDATHRAFRIAAGWLTCLPAFLFVLYGTMHLVPGSAGLLYTQQPAHELTRYPLRLFSPYAASLFVSILAALPLPLRPALSAAR